MQVGLTAIDWVVIALYFVFAIGLGLYLSRRVGGGVESFFVSSRQLPWWLAGTSMVATTFAADTPLAVTGIVAADGIAGNWLWWCWAIAHLTATFFFARMWKRSGVITDAEIVELRYAGRTAAALRAFKAVYFGLFINCLTMAWVIAAMVKISRAFFTVNPAVVIAVCMIGSVVYTSLGGFRSVVVTDFLQFALGMAGALALAYFVSAEFGGLGSLPTADAEGAGLLGSLATSIEGSTRSLHDVLDFLPAKDHPTISRVYLAVLLIAGWWRLAEGNGYIVQRLAACRDERHAQAASLWFAVAHNALRPWPWIVVGLAALVVYPETGASGPPSVEAALARDGNVEILRVRPQRIDLAGDTSLYSGSIPADCRTELGGRLVQWREVSAGGGAGLIGRRELRADLTGWPEGGSLALKIRCPGIESVHLGDIDIVLGDREMAYPLLMRRSLPPLVLGLVVASLLAAFMSTVDTHINWGASYLIQDLYRRFIRPQAPDSHYLAASRVAILLMAVLAGLSALFVENIATVWRFLITLGAGLGSVTAARWFWPRVTPHAEFVALGITTVSAIALEFSSPIFGIDFAAATKIVIIAAVSLMAWVPTALWGPQNPTAVLEAFARKVKPPGPGWSRYLAEPSESLAPSAARFAAGLVVVFGGLFGIGAVVLGNTMTGLAWIAVATLLAVSSSIQSRSKEPR